MWRMAETLDQCTTAFEWVTSELQISGIKGELQISGIKGGCGHQHSVQTIHRGNQISDPTFIWFYH